ncbi:DUF6795 domain-containing protein [Microbulbifer sp. DLAB2-AF]|uniref:DUF6795 domain-containing protein n=1 Tax=Microbulbifer sp. DLAB2-AF TaxID=3243395 RepID=UPI00403990B5
MKKLNSQIYIVLITFFLPLISGGANAMAFLNPLKACTFSEMKIRLTLDGKPAVGAKITRSVDWKDEKIDFFTSDGEGNVKLPAKFESSVTQVLPVEFISSQSINVEYENKNYLIWIYAKRNPGENSEMNGNPINLSCELTDEPKTERKFKSALKTSCKFL